MRPSPPPEEPSALLRDAERDVDAILVAQLLAAPEFRDWFLASTGSGPIGERRLRVTPVRRTRKADTGLDLVLMLDGGKLSDAVLVSNRLWPVPRLARQARAEAAAMAQARTARGIRLVLIRPEAAVHAGEVYTAFDAILTLDALKQRLDARAAAAQGELASHLGHHAVLVGRALDLADSALRTEPPHSVEDFLDDYEALLAEAVPALGADDETPPDRPESDVPLVDFGRACLPGWPFLPPLRLAHHLREGVVSLTFYGWGPYLTELGQVMEPALSRTPYRIGLTARRRPDASPGLMLVDTVPVLDTAKPLATQVERAVEGMLAADRLRQWFEGQRNTARLWAESVGGLRPHERISRYDRGLVLS